MARSDQVLVYAGKVRTETATWRDAYGVTRTARQMETSHLWNVMGYIREHQYRQGSSWNKNFYQAAAYELRRRRVIP